MSDNDEPQKDFQEAANRIMDRMRGQGSGGRDPDRIDDVLKTIRDIWEKQPDLRLGQLILNAIHEDNLYYTEDDALVDALEDMYGEQS